jgi:hypothetical protein
MTSTRLVLLTVGLLALALLSGRLLAGALKARALLRFDPTAAAASAILGIATCTVGFGALSAAGVEAPRAARLLLAGHLGALVVCWGRATFRALWPVGSLRGWLGLLAAWTAGLFLALLPVIRTGGFATCNDTYHYAAFSEWLQGNAWGAGVRWDPMSPVTYIPAMFQGVGYPLGAAYLLALTQAAVASSSALGLYPAVSALGILLNTSAQYVVARWVFRLPERWAATSSLAFALVPHSIYWGHHNGFLQQTYGLCALLLALALLGRASRPADWDVATAALLALLAAYIVLVYLPMGPPLAIAFIPWAWISGRRALRRHALARWLLPLAVYAVLFVVFGHTELRGIWERLFTFALGQAGGHISFGAFDYLSFAVGTRIVAPDWSPGLAQWLRQSLPYLTFLQGALLVGGLWMALRRPRTWVLLSALASVLAAALYYAAFARDPWNGEIGHTWNLFKLSQYALPLLWAFWVFGLRRLLCRWPPSAHPVELGGLVLAAGVVFIHWTWSEELGLAMRALVPAERPLEVLPDLRRRLQGLPEGTLLVIGRPAAQQACLGDTLALMAYPRAILSDWEGTYHVSPFPEAPAKINSILATPEDSGALALVAGPPPFSSEGAETLGPGLSWLHDWRPRVIRVEEHGVPSAPRPAGTFEWTGQGRLRITVFSPRVSQAVLELTARPRSPRAGAAQREWIVVRTVPGELRGPALRSALDAASRQAVGLDPDEGQIRLPITVERGTTTVAIDRRDGPPAPGTVILSIAGIRLLDVS